MQFLMEDQMKSNELMKDILEVIPTAIFIADEDLIIYDVNDPFNKIFLTENVNIQGTKLGNLFHCSNTSCNMNICGTTIHCTKCLLRNFVKETISDTQRIYKKRFYKTFELGYETISKCLEFNSRPIVFKDKTFAIVFLDDVTEDDQKSKKIDEQFKLLRANEATLIDRVNEQTIQLKRVTMSLITALESANYYNDTDTGNHIRRVCEYSVIIANGLGCDKTFVEKIGLYASLHDIGKVGIPDRLLKKEGLYSVDERQEMMNHVIIGARMLENAQMDDMLINIIKYHHERFDGEGYTNKLKGEELPLEARIVALADVYDALSTKRSYKEAYSEARVDEIIRESSGKHFDPNIVDVFYKCKQTILEVKKAYLDKDESNFVEIGYENQINIINFQGRISLDTVDGLYEKIDQELNSRKEEKKGHLFNISKIKYMDSVGFGLLIRIHKQIKTTSEQTVIVNNNEAIKDLLSVFKINELFKVFNSVEEAMVFFKT